MFKLFNNSVAIVLIMATLSTNAASTSIDKTVINVQGSHVNQRVNVIERYYTALETKNYTVFKDIFTKNGSVITTQAGAINPSLFFPKRFATINVFHVTLLAIYGFKNHYFVRYHLEINENGKTTTREFLEEFIFTSTNTQIKTIHMFENKY